MEKLVAGIKIPEVKNNLDNFIVFNEYGQNMNNF